MMNSGINKSTTRARQSFGEWSTDSEFSWSERPNQDLPATEKCNQQSEIASRRVAAYWESRK